MDQLLSGWWVVGQWIYPKFNPLVLKTIDNVKGGTSVDTKKEANTFL